ncbi:phosphomethylpyrimidine synthase ThiC [Adlercreutzia murintestinalis]|uniref:phosphomethylpyrimidine synthase ThiC n=1 Tax=Adlercreutzia murintestinalis TaxID=2941325 RepID=UPI00255822C8|nr:phosphomethylpyrimidine synthase ThiC [Adlercreutzia murintestinalis]
MTTVTDQDHATDEPRVASGAERACTTQIDFARAGRVTPQMQAVAQAEQLDVEDVRQAVACGRVAIPANIHHAALAPAGVGSLLDGRPLSTKVNVNLGISGDKADEAQEWRKVDVALELGADAIMDLSNSGKTESFRRRLIERAPAMIGTVPMYDALGYLEKALIHITAQDFLDVVRKHAEDGVDFVTVHAGMNRRVIDSFKETGRLTNIVSRGGSLIFAWMEATGNENPFYEHYDEVLDILHAHDVTISIGDAMRPGSTYDATDAGQIAELIEIGKLTQRAWDAGVQVMVEGPGHMALDEIAANMKFQKRLCHDAPFYGLGPLVCDIAPGYDHITAAIGGAVAASAGADFLCYVTPAEHLRLPDAQDVREGLVATKIAAHAADIAKGVAHARDRDNRMSDARRRVAWDEMFSLALDPVRAREYFESAPPATEGTCTMCGAMCAMRTVNQLMDDNVVDLGL